MNKKTIVAIILMSFLTITIFSFPVMIGADGQMAGDCPFAMNGLSLCPQEALAVAAHHIAAYRSFFNISVNSGITASILIYLFLLAAIFIISISPPLFSPSILARHLENFPFVVRRNKKITRWLARLENSPSVK